jgi:RNA polymerase sigma-70 factor, ECF subfamily
VTLRFEDVYQRWFDDVERWARAMSGLDADTADLAQEVFLTVRRRLGSFEGGSLRAWLYKITRLTVSDQRRRAWWKNLLRRMPGVEPDDLPSGDLRTEVERREGDRLLREALGRMTVAHRTALVLFEIEGYSGEEIAELEGVPIGTVWARLHRARKDFVAAVAAIERQRSE